MLKREIKFKDLDGNDAAETFYFNLSEAELVELEVSYDGLGFEEAMRRIIEAKDAKSIVDEFKKIILMTIGQRDGHFFIKTPEYATRFSQHPAYSVLFMELATDAEKGATFLKGVLPAHMSAQLEAQELGDKVANVIPPIPDLPAPVVLTTTNITE